MKYNEVFTREQVLSNIPLAIDGRKLSNDMQAKVMIMRVAYDKEANSFNQDMQEIAKGLKKEGFDERTQAIQKMEDVDRRKKAAEEWKEGDVDKDGKKVEKPAMPTNEEIEEAEKTRSTKEEYDKELAEFNEKYISAHNKKMAEESGMKERLFTEQEFSEIIGVIGSEGKISFKNGDNKAEISREDFLGIIAAWLVKA